MQLVWDEVGERFYETGVDHGVLYIPNAQGVYDSGVAWNGLTSVQETPSGAEANPQYADNIKYLNLFSAEEFGATIEAFTYPEEFNQFDGLGAPSPGVTLGQQNRGVFGFSYRTKVGNDLEGDDHAYKLHLVYGAKASPSEKAYNTVSDSPEAIQFSWEITTTPVAAPAPWKPTAIITIDSRDVGAANLDALEDALYGTAGTDPRLPLPEEILGMFAGGITEVTPEVPTYVDATDTLTIPAQVGVEYYINDELQPSGAQVITEDVFVVARPAAGYSFPDGVDTDWFFNFTP